MSKRTSRRRFLAQAGAVAAGFAGLRTFVACRPPSSADDRAGLDEAVYGPLQADPRRILDLPRGFSYQIISRRGEVMDDGFFVPDKADGMAAFAGPQGLTLLLCNHEVDTWAEPADGPFGDDFARLSSLAPEKIYDAGREGGPCLGGVTTLVYDTRSGRVLRRFLSLAGTVRNCAGGPTPWGSWITCEESVESAGDFCARDHGYNFEVPATHRPALADPVPLKAMGRFNHEAVAVHPNSGAIYQSEDRPDGVLYRFLPNVPGQLSRGGRLQVLEAIGRLNLDTRNWHAPLAAPGESIPVRWIDLDEADGPDDDLRYRSQDLGAALFARTEGMWYGNGSLYFACTNGGPAARGQVWRYRPSRSEGRPGEASDPARLELFVQAESDADLIDNADNLTVAPWGDLILCEDGGGDQFIVGVTPEGGLYRLARNAMSRSEFAGAVFSPDGGTLFVNIQHDGLTLAVTGDWRQT